jgi:hypothetical protein
MLYRRGTRPVSSFPAEFSPLFSLLFAFFSPIPAEFSSVSAAFSPRFFVLMAVHRPSAPSRSGFTQLLLK